LGTPPGVKGTVPNGGFTGVWGKLSRVYGGGGKTFFNGYPRGGPVKKGFPEKGVFSRKTFYPG